MSLDAGAVLSLSQVIIIVDKSFTSHRHDPDLLRVRKIWKYTAFYAHLGL